MLVIKSIHPVCRLLGSSLFCSTHDRHDAFSHVSFLKSISASILLLLKWTGTLFTGKEQNMDIFLFTHDSLNA